jgi:predicted TIM-barrel fold metal-dependent hydrolase
VPAAVPGSCDAQVHVFSPDSLRYPPAAKRIYDPPLGSMEDAMRMHAALGMERGVVVQATIYGTDNRLMADSIAGRKNYRGIAIVDDSVSDDELLRLHAAGVRGARFNFASFLGLVPSADEFRRSIRRITELGWHARVHSSGDELLGIEGLLREVTCPIVIDHMAHLEFSRGMGDALERRSQFGARARMVGCASLRAALSRGGTGSRDLVYGLATRALS